MWCMSVKNKHAQLRLPLGCEASAIVSSEGILSQTC